MSECVRREWKHGGLEGWELSGLWGRGGGKGAGGSDVHSALLS